jgi:hypothetical protein
MRKGAQEPAGPFARDGADISAALWSMTDLAEMIDAS